MGWLYRLELRTSDLGHRKKQISHFVRNDIVNVAGTETRPLQSLTKSELLHIDITAAGMSLNYLNMQLP